MSKINDIKNRMLNAVEDENVKDIFFAALKIAKEYAEGMIEYELDIDQHS